MRVPLKDKVEGLRVGVKRLNTHWWLLFVAFVLIGCGTGILFGRTDGRLFTIQLRVIQLEEANATIQPEVCALNYSTEEMKKQIDILKEKITKQKKDMAELQAKFQKLVDAYSKTKKN
jgi:peptidoglycan hydrolase CwlO-like protein